MLTSVSKREIVHPGSGARFQTAHGANGIVEKLPLIFFGKLSGVSLGKSDLCSHRQHQSEGSQSFHRTARREWPGN
ncbi:MAG: hypothetical protein DME66_02620 [Verrucomicrobia bacterium]|nr:MAG: hypothetical protein DME66_02620 [Verrucomicrobiota bacterium]